MDILEKYHKENPEAFREQRHEYANLSGTPKIVQWVIKWSGGYVKDEKQAGYVLMGFVAAALVCSFLILRGSSDNVQNESRAVIERSINATNAPR